MSFHVSFRRPSNVGMRAIVGVGAVVGVVVGGGAVVLVGRALRWWFVGAWLLVVVGGFCLGYAANRSLFGVCCGGGSSSAGRELRIGPVESPRGES